MGAAPGLAQLPAAVRGNPDDQVAIDGRIAARLVEMELSPEGVGCRICAARNLEGEISEFTLVEARPLVLVEAGEPALLSEVLQELPGLQRLSAAGLFPDIVLP